MQKRLERSSSLQYKMKLENQTAIVTGGGRGIGKAIALALAREGANVLVCGRHEETLQQTARDIEQLGRRALAIVADVSQDQEVEAMVQAALHEFGQREHPGEQRRHCGTNSTHHQRHQERLGRNARSESDQRLSLRPKAVLPAMIERRSGKIINISSVAGRMAYALRAPYAVSKWGMIGLTRTLAQEAGPHNIQVNAVLPGPTAGERMQTVIDQRAQELGQSAAEVEKNYVEATALKRMVDPEHVAATVVFLASSDGDSITGQAIDVTAGVAL